MLGAPTNLHKFAAEISVAVNVGEGTAGLMRLQWAVGVVRLQWRMETCSNDKARVPFWSAASSPGVREQASRVTLGATVDEILQPTCGSAKDGVVGEWQTASPFMESLWGRQARVENRRLWRRASFLGHLPSVIGVPSHSQLLFC